MSPPKWDVMWCPFHSDRFITWDHDAQLSLCEIGAQGSVRDSNQIFSKCEHATLLLGILWIPTWLCQVWTNVVKNIVLFWDVQHWLRSTWCYKCFKTFFDWSISKILSSGWSIKRFEAFVASSGQQPLFKRLRTIDSRNRDKYGKYKIIE